MPPLAMFNPCQPCCKVSSCWCDSTMPPIITVCMDGFPVDAFVSFYSLHLDKFNGIHTLNLTDVYSPDSKDIIINNIHYHPGATECVWGLDLGDGYYISMFFSYVAPVGIQINLVLTIPAPDIDGHPISSLTWELITPGIQALSCTGRYVMNSGGPLNTYNSVLLLQWTHNVTAIINCDNTNYHQHLQARLYNSSRNNGQLYNSGVFGANCSIFNSIAVMTYDAINNDWVYIWPDAIHYVNFYITGNQLICNFGKLNSTYKITYSVTLPNTNPNYNWQQSYDNGDVYLLKDLIANTSDCSQVPGGVFIGPM